MEARVYHPNKLEVSGHDQDQRHKVEADKHGYVVAEHVKRAPVPHHAAACAGSLETVGGPAKQRKSCPD